MATSGLSVPPEECQFMDLPEMVYGNIFQYLDYDSRITCRQVCSQWRDSTDNRLGFTLTIDDRDPANTEFAKNIPIREAYVLSLRDPPSNFFTKPKALRVAKFYGHIPIPWFTNHVLKACPNLTKLVLRGDFMVAQKLTPNFPEETTTDSVFCPNLKSLELIFNEPDNFPYYPKGNPEPLPGEDGDDLDYITSSQFWPRLAMGMLDGIYAVNVNRFDDPRLPAILKVVQTVDRNMTFLLKLIRSERLELLHIHDAVFPLYGTYRYWSLSWKGAALREFLQHHSKTLRYLYLPAYLGHDDSSPTTWGPTYPRDLWEIEILLHYRDMRRMNSIWTQMISTQTCLQEITLNIFRFPLAFYQALFWSFPPTLRKIIVRIQLQPGDYQARLEINGRAFSQFRYLEYFHLQNVHGRWGWNDLGFTNGSVTFTNLGVLPPTLRILILRKINVAPFLADKLLRFRKLCHMQIGSLRQSRNEPNNASKIFRHILQMRRLNSVEIYFRDDIRNDAECAVTLKPIFPPISKPDPNCSDSGILSFCIDFFSISSPQRTINPYKDGTGMALLNYYSDKEKGNILGFRMLPQRLSNQTAFLELFEAPKNRETTFRIYDSGNLYLGPFQDIFWNEMISVEKCMTVELIVKKSLEEQARLRRLLQQEVEVCGCCMDPVFNELFLLDETDD